MLRHGIARTQQQMSRLCGRNSSWVSCLKARKRRMSVEGLTKLAANIERYARLNKDWQEEMRLIDLRDVLMREVMWRAHETAVEFRAKHDQRQANALP